MYKEKLYNFYTYYKGEVIGAGIGALFGIFVLVIGFWKTIFIGLCTFAGFYVGRKFSNKEDFMSFLDKILPPSKI